MAPGDASQRYLASRAWGAWPRRECLRGDPAHPGLQTRDLAAMSDEHEPARPAPGSDDAATQEATGARCQ